MVRTIRIAILLSTLLAACGGDDGGNTGPDTEAPSVAVTSPVQGAALQGVVIVVAAASDNDEVAGVRFQLDGVNLGTEDLSAPYLAAWETSGASDGPHTLTAIARDAAGNVGTSAAVAVTVANPLPGSIELTVTTTGPGGDADGYTLRLDGTGRGPLAANATMTLSGLPAGPHTVDLAGVWPFCTVGGEHPRTVEVPAGAAVAVTIEVACAGGPDGRIAYTLPSGFGDPSLRIVRLGDGSDVPLSDHGFGVVWSPDETRLAFIRGGELYRIDADGGGEVPLAVLPALPGELDWGPDGTIAFTAEREVPAGTLRDIYLIDSDGTDLRPLFADPAPRAGPALSPDGTEVAFSVLAPGGEASLWIAGLDGGNRRQLTTGFVDRAADWSPDGARLAFSRSGVGTFDPDVLMIGADGSGLVILTGAGASGDNPDWSPDGQWVAFVGVGSIDSGDVGIWIVREDGSSAVAVAPFGTIPSWGP